jgi:hypothetical protein
MLNKHLTGQWINEAKLHTRTYWLYSKFLGFVLCLVVYFPIMQKLTHVFKLLRAPHMCSIYACSPCGKLVRKFMFCNSIFNIFLIS